jgi:hypothetical protein
MINKEGKLFGKISIIDILVILAIAIAALSVYIRFFAGNEKVKTSLSHIEYTMKVREVRQGTVDALKNYLGPIYDETTKEYLGNIVDVSYEESTKGVELANGKIVASEIPNRYNALVTVSLDGKINDRGYYTQNNKAITAGSTYIFLSKAVKTTGVVVDVYEKK